MSDTTGPRPPLALSIREAAEATGISDKALRRRIERGTLPSVRSGGLVHVPRSALIEAGLLSPDWPATGTAGAAAGAPEGSGAPRGTPQGNLDIGALLDRLESQAQEVGRLRALTVKAESLEAESERLRSELLEARARIATLEQQSSAAPAPSPRRLRLPWRSP